MKIVFFDFDGTLTTKDTLRPFATYVAKRYSLRHNLLLFYGLLLLYRLKLISDKNLKEAFLKLFIKKRNKAEVDNVVKTFLQDKLNCFINQTVFEKLKSHVASGDKVYIASANFDFLLKPLIKNWDLSGIISTESEIIENLFSGRIIGNTCKGQIKISKIKALFGEEKLKSAIVYGDSEDKHLLNSVGYGVKIS